MRLTPFLGILIAVLSLCGVRLPATTVLSSGQDRNSSCSASSSDIIDSEEGHVPGSRVYPNSTGKDYTFDAPWRVKSATTPIPFMLEIKDAHIYDLDALKHWTMSYRNESGQYIVFYDYDFGSLQITDEYFVRFTSFPASTFGASSGDTVFIKCDMLFQDITSTDAHFIKYLRIIVGNELPQIEGWYFGDTHFHTSYTNNPYEYGGNLEMTRLCGEAMGLHWTTTNDHASDNSSWLGIIEVNDFNSEEWPILGDWIAQNNIDHEFKFIRGEEITCNDDNVEIEDKASIHLLVYGNPSFVAGPIGLSGDGNTIRPLPEVMNEIEQMGGFTYAAHPLDNGDPLVFLALAPWSGDNYADALTFEHFRGVETWNGRLTGHCSANDFDEYDQNPFPWTPVSPWDEMLRDGIDQWDSLNIAMLSGEQPRRVFLEGGSDAHGDFNYRTNMSGTVATEASDNAFGKVMTAVYSADGLGGQAENIQNGLRLGRTVVTDGPLVICGIDADNNGDIGAGDLQIGDTGSYNLEDDQEFLYKWSSTPDFGPIRHVKVLIGHPSLMDPEVAETVVDNISLNDFTGIRGVDLSSILRDRAILGWTFVRVEGYTEDWSYRCYSNPIWINVYDGSAIDVRQIESPELPHSYSLCQNYPNPFNPTTRIEFAIPRASFVEFHIFNILGKRLRTLVSERLTAGRKAVIWDGTDERGIPVASGVYIYQIKTDGFADARKMLLLK